MDIILAFCSAVFASLVAILSKIGIKDVNSNLATAVRTVVVLVMSFIVVAVTGHLAELSAVSPRALLFIVLSGVATGLSWLCFFKAVQLGDVSKVVPIDKLSIVVTLVLSAVILNEEMTATVVLGGAVILVGTLVLILKFKKKDKPLAETAVTENVQEETAAENADEVKAEKKKPFGSYIFLALLSAVFAGLTSILAKIGINEVDSSVATFIRTIVILVFSWSIVLARGEQKGAKQMGKRNLWFLIFSGVATGLSWLCYFYAIALGRVSIVAPIDKFSVVITMLLSFVILKEKPSVQTVVGCLTITAGTIILLIK